MASLKITTEINNTSKKLRTPGEGKNYTVTTTGDNADFRSLTVTESGEVTLTFTTDIGNAGYVYLRNNDDTNFVQYGYATTVYNQRISAGSTAIFELNPTIASLYLRADTADCNVDCWILEA